MAIGLAMPTTQYAGEKETDLTRTTATRRQKLRVKARYVHITALGSLLFCGSSPKCLTREPDAGNLHVRFDEGEGAAAPAAAPLYSTVFRCARQSLADLAG